MQTYAHPAGLEKSCQTHIFLQNFVLIQPRTSPPKNCKIKFQIAKFSKNGFKMHVRKCIFEKCILRKCIFLKFANFWRARSRLYRNEILQENMRLTAFFKLYKICILLHRCNLKILGKKIGLKNQQFP